MFDHLVVDNELVGEFEKYELDEHDRIFIKDLIEGKNEQNGVKKN